MIPTPQKNQDFAVQQELQIEHYFIGGTYARRQILKAGASISTHKHKFDHMSILAKGVANVTVDGVSIIYNAPTVIEVKAEKAHRIESLEEVHWYCIHATNITDPDLIDHETLLED